MTERQDPVAPHRRSNPRTFGGMAVVVLAAIVGVVVIVVAAGREEEASSRFEAGAPDGPRSTLPPRSKPTTTTTTAVTTTVPTTWAISGEPSADEVQAYLVRFDLVGWYPDRPRDELVEAGVAVCATFDRTGVEASLDDVKAFLAASGYDEPFKVVVAATLTLCDEHLVAAALAAGD